MDLSNKSTSQVIINKAVTNDSAPQKNNSDPVPPTKSLPDKTNPCSNANISTCFKLIEVEMNKTEAMLKTANQTLAKKSSAPSAPAPLSPPALKPLPKLPAPANASANNNVAKQPKVPLPQLGNTTSTTKGNNTMALSPSNQTLVNKPPQQQQPQPVSIAPANPAQTPPPLPLVKATPQPSAVMANPPLLQQQQLQQLLAQPPQQQQQQLQQQLQQLRRPRRSADDKQKEREEAERRRVLESLADRKGTGLKEAKEEAKHSELGGVAMLDREDDSTKPSSTTTEKKTKASLSPTTSTTQEETEGTSKKNRLRVIFPRREVIRQKQEESLKLLQRDREEDSTAKVFESEIETKGTPRQIIGTVTTTRTSPERKSTEKTLIVRKGTRPSKNRRKMRRHRVRTNLGLITSQLSPRLSSVPRKRERITSATTSPTEKSVRLHTILVPKKRRRLSAMQQPVAERVMDHFSVDSKNGAKQELSEAALLSEAEKDGNGVGVPFPELEEGYCFSCIRVIIRLVT